MKIYQIYMLLFIFLMFGCGKATANQLHDGDIIFQTSTSSQSSAIQIATKSKYSHVGILFFQDGKPYVFEALQTVQYTPLNEWIIRGEGGKYVIKRLYNADAIMTSQAIERLKAVASTFKGKPYDLTFEWSDDSMYCSELVWKIFDRGMNIQIGQLKKLGDFDLSNSIVKKSMRERYGVHVPIHQTVVSPADMFSSELLQTVSEN